ncbi:MAG: TetR/AcrR family transcriptional regulator [Clostridia bacterium]|nr:TetR/AcrR family transcriptional regulator [Clostridia bacterium]
MLKGGFTIKERILSAFLDLAAKKGFYRVTMDELSAEAGISKRTLYRYYRSKDELVEAAIDVFLADISEKINELTAVHYNPDEMFIQIFKYVNHLRLNIGNPLVLDDLRQHYPHLWKKIAAFRKEIIKNVFMAKLFHEENKAYLRDLDYRVVITAMLAAIDAVGNPEFILSNGLTFEETVKQLIEFFKHGFLKEKNK